MTRINLEDTGMSILTKMSDGNPGAPHAMMDILEKARDIDPQSALGGIGAILSFDTIGVYGTEIYILYNDQCNRDVRELLMLMRAHQLGFISESRIVKIAKDQMRQFLLSGEEMDELNKKVCEQLESFAPRVVEETLANK